METKEKEIWKDIPGYEGYYQASNMGNVRSVDRWVTYSNGKECFYRGRILEGYVHKGYRRVRLTINSEGKTLTTSQLVAITFLNHIPDGHKLVVDHIDGDKSNDRVENLRIVTHRQNLSNVCFRKDRDSLSSRFTGVGIHKQSNRWMSRIQYEGVRINLGLFNTQVEAYQAYQTALNKVKDNTFNPDEYKPVYTSRYTGVGFHKKSNKWQSRVRVNKKYKHLGLYPTEIEAYEAIQKFERDNNIK